MDSKAKAIVDRLLEAVIVPAKSILGDTFGSDFSRLPPGIKDICHVKYQRWKRNPSELNFELKFGNWYSVEITRKYHALCQVEGSPTAATVYWRRVLSYDDYRKYLNLQRKTDPRR